MANVHTESPTRELAKNLQGIDFPVDRSKLIEYAREHGASEETCKKLEGMPDEEYTSMADVFKGFGQKEK